MKAADSKRGPDMGIDCFLPSGCSPTSAWPPPVSFLRAPHDAATASAADHATRCGRRAAGRMTLMLPARAEEPDRSVRALVVEQVLDGGAEHVVAVLRPQAHDLDRAARLVAGRDRDVV